MTTIRTIRTNRSIRTIRSMRTTSTTRTIRTTRTFRSMRTIRTSVTGAFELLRYWPVHAVVVDDLDLQPEVVRRAPLRQPLWLQVHVMHDLQQQQLQVSRGSSSHFSDVMTSDSIKSPNFKCQITFGLFIVIVSIYIYIYNISLIVDDSLCIYNTLPSKD